MEGMSQVAGDSKVLLAVLKDQRDLQLLLQRRWYRIPLRYAPRRPFGFIAFYQGAKSNQGKGRVRYYAPVLNRKIWKRNRILPEEPEHPRARQNYYLFRLGRARKLPSTILNKNRTRVCFGFTTLARLRKAKNVLDLFGVPPIEDILYRALRRQGISPVREHCVLTGRTCKYRLDFAISCTRGMINVECDGEKGHTSIGQRRKDRLRDRYLKRRGWTIVRFSQSSILSHLNCCVITVKEAVRRLGGLNNR